MPHKRRGHGHHKHPTEADEQGGAAATPPEVHHTSRFSSNHPSAGSSYGKSQSSQATPKPAAQVSAGKPALFEVQVEVPPAAAKGVQEVDPFDALANILPSADSIAPKQPVYTGPEVKELNVTSEKGHKTGERDSTLPPGYRFEDMPSVPADVEPKDVPKPMSTGEALDSLSGAFMTSTVPAAPKKQEKKEFVENVSASSAGPANFAPPPVKKYQTPAEVPPVAGRPPADKKAKMEKVSGDFSLMSGLDTKVDTKPKTDGGDSMSLDALSALVDTLPEDKPKPELPELRPEDIVSEKKHNKEKGVLVGEREDSIHPDYRFNKEELKKLPAPKPEPTMATGDALDILSGGFMTSATAPSVQAPPAKPTMGTGDALDILSGDFMTSSSAPTVKAPVITPSAPPAQRSSDFVLDAMAPEFVSSSAATTVKSAVYAPTKTDPELSPGADSALDALDALDALSDTLKDIAPAPQPAPPPAKDIVKEKKAVEERLIKMGERDDSLPPEYRPTEEDLKKMAEAKAKAAAAPKEKTMDNKTALDLLSSDFSAAPAAPAAPAAVTTKLEPPVLDSEPLKPMAGPVLESLSDTLLPDTPELKSKTDKPKGKSKSKSKSKKHSAEEPSAAEQLPAQPSSDVVPKSTKKGHRS